jgi:citrate lyase beta subunit
MEFYMLTEEEIRNELEIINATEDALQARGYECDERIDKMSEEELRDVLEEARRLIAKKKARKKQAESESETEKEQEQQITA